MNKKISIVVAILFFLGCSGVIDQTNLAGINSLDQLEKKYDYLSRQYQKKLRKDPNNKKLRLKLANFYYKFRDYQKIENILSNIDSYKARRLLAKSLAKQKKYDQAIEVYQIIKDKLKDPEGLFLYGETLEQKNLFPKALEIYAKVGKPYAREANKKIKSIQKKIANIVPEGIKQLSKQAESFLAKTKDEAAVILSVDESIEILPNHTSVSTICVVKQVLKERGKELAEVKIGYDSTYEKIELEYARTITKDKKVVSVGKENIRDVSRYLDFPLYSNSRAFIISMPSVGIGSYLEYKVKIYSSKLIAKDNFNFIYRLREKYPIFKANFKLTVPKDKEVNIKFFNQNQAKDISLEPLLERGRKKKIYSWSFKQLNSIVPEYNMPPFPYINPAILVSSFSSWQEIYSWWFSLYADKLQTTLEMERLLKDLIKDKKTNKDKAKAIYEYVAKNIRYVAVEYGDSGYQPHSASEVFVNKYGDCKDQAVLLVALLQEAGLDAYPVLIPTRSSYPINKNFPSINFNHAIAATRIDGNFIFMDPTSNTTPFGQIPLPDQDRAVLLFLKEGYKVLKTPSSKDNGIEYLMDINIDESEDAEITREVSTKGYYASGYRSYLKYTHPSRIKEDISQKMVEISPFSHLLNLTVKNEKDLDKQPLLIYSFVADNFLSPSGAFRILEPLDQFNFKASLISKEERNFPIDFGGIFSKTARIKVVLPPNIKVKYLPDSKNFENKWFSLNTNYKSKEQTINFSQIFSVKKRFVSKKEYQDFRKKFKEIIYYLKGQIILKTEKTKRVDNDR
ncbi:MAG: DUF3857 domain-containing protein [Candidatus Omnitrophica bacterium]|nr:DUF3857 domain-containing protein [Candidatus Omnitrophota bacterium]MCF7894011.1 DUF3857 domain-containing protein [Candidatus Omnitrophota bacterium]